MNTKLIIFLFILFSFFSVKGQTEFSTDAGVYNTLLNDLKISLYENSRIETITLDGKERRMFVTWVRDHIHTMKAYKYWEKDSIFYKQFQNI